jgi:DNA-binding LytR/AlgR family response regulator
MSRKLFWRVYNWNWKMMAQNKIKCLLVDDQPLALEVLKSHIQNVPFLEVTGECRHALAAFESLQKNQVDLMFLDVQMPRLNGIDFLKSLVHPPHVIFTTAYRDYALEGFELNAIDYLLKPISLERFLKAVYKLTQSNPIGVSESHQTASERFLYFRSDRKMTKVMLNDILFIESLKDYIKIVTMKGSILTKQSISSVEAMLPEEGFVRIHRSFIVSLNKIDSYSATGIYIGKSELPIGPLYKHEVGNRLKVHL